MLLSYNWLKEFVDFTASPEELKKILTEKVAEVENVRVYKLDINDKVITAQIQKIERHPNADKLTYCTVDTGSETLKIVCGAKNHREGDKVFLALDGAVLPENFKIKKTIIRGLESNGMLCSGKELGILDEETEGIMILDSQTPLGKKLYTFGNFSDYVLEIDNKSITHRPDLWGHYGFAREIAAIYGKELKKLDSSKQLKSSAHHELPLTIRVENAEACPRYSALILDNIHITSSPLWLKFRLNTLGFRAINSVVDVTNYILLELGQPTHAFDYHKIKDTTIVIRDAKENETIETLDGTKRTLAKTNLVIAHNTHPIAIAGVMGGKITEVDKATTAIIIESAHFHPTSIRKTSTHFELRTESSMRFEKALDPNLTTQAIARITELLQTIDTNSAIASNVFDISRVQDKHVTIHVPIDFVQKKIGSVLSLETAQEILERLDFKVETTKDTLMVSVPSFRATKDIRIKEDIVEEIGRIYGYNKIEPQAPLVPMYIPQNPRGVTLTRTIKTILATTLHYSEILTHSFIKNKNIDVCSINKDELVKLQNPLSHEEEYLKPSLIPNLLDMIPKNAKHMHELKIFELCNVFSKQGMNHDEHTELAMIVNYSTVDPFDSKTSSSLFYAFKEDIETLAHILKIPVSIEEASKPLKWLHSKKSACIMSGETTLGYFGELSLSLAQQFDIRGMTFIATINMEKLKNLSTAQKNFISLPKYPSSDLEFSIVSSKTTKVQEIEKIIRAVNNELIDNVRLIAHYEGTQLGENEKSSSFKVTLQSQSKTLEDEEIKKVQTIIIQTLEQQGWKLR